MNLLTKRTVYLFLTVIMLLFFAQSSFAQNNPDTTQLQFGGPGSVTGQQIEDAKPKATLFDVDIMQGYYDWKDRLKKNSGFSYTVDYTSGLFTATNTLNEENTFASGAIRFFSSWDLVGRGTKNTGTFIFKIENRHGYTSIPASGTASQIGYVGLFLPTLSDIGTRLTNLYWKQNLLGGRLELIGGFIDVTDWVDLYILASPWNGFFNFANATGSATIPVPDDATIGAYVNYLITDNLYVIGGLADANANSTDPFNGFSTFFNDNEYFKSLELGWINSQDRFYFNNTHITYWHVDERKNAGVSAGWGLNFSISHTFGLKWMPYLRGGYADKGGSLLQKSLSAGLGYHLKDGISLVGLGFNWNQPNEDTYGQKLRNQFSTELFCRFQVIKRFELTPDIQWVINPARNPTVDQSWVFGLRGRIILL